MEEIKTGVEIYDAIDDARGNRVPELVKQKWVSVDWIKKQIKEQQELKKKDKGWNVYYNKALVWIDTLITDICLDCKNNLGEDCHEAELSETVSTDDGRCLECKHFTPKE